MQVSGSFLGRAEAWDWFAVDAYDRYIFGQSLLRTAFSQTRTKFDWEVEIKAPGLFNLPADAVGPNGAPMGIGEFYYAANNYATNAR